RPGCSEPWTVLGGARRGGVQPGVDDDGHAGREFLLGQVGAVPAHQGGLLGVGDDEVERVEGPQLVPAQAQGARGGGPQRKLAPAAAGHSRRHGGVEHGPPSRSGEFLHPPVEYCGHARRCRLRGCNRQPGAAGLGVATTDEVRPLRPVLSWPVKRAVHHFVAEGGQQNRDGSGGIEPLNGGTHWDCSSVSPVNGSERAPSASTVGSGCATRLRLSQHAFFQYGTGWWSMVQQDGQAAQPEASDVGLTSAQAAQRLAAGLGNDVPVRASRTVGQIIRANVFTRINAMVAVLFGVIAVIGPVQDGLFALVIVINTLVGIVQELRAKKTLDSLAFINAARPRVVRDGVAVEVRPQEVVLDDVIELGSGDQAVVDGVVVSASGLEVDESLLTGEADPVLKQPGDPILSGSFVVAGSGRFRATRVGRDAYAARITEEAS